ncbi:hypothetical protein D3C85_707290 [compost metagenome]
MNALVSQLFDVRIDNDLNRIAQVDPCSNCRVLGRKFAVRIDTVGYSFSRHAELTCHLFQLLVNLFPVSGEFSLIALHHLAVSDLDRKG